MASMEYMGYSAFIDYDGEADTFFGHVVNLSSPITFYGKTTEELRREFALSVETWLALCKERGIQAEKPYSGRITVRMSPDMHRKIATAAAEAGQSVNTWVVHSLQECATANMHIELQ